MATMFLKQAERIAIYAGVAGAIYLGLAAQHDVSKADAQAGSQVTLRIATADVLNVAERLIATDKYKSARDTLANSLNKELQSKVDALKDVQAQFEALPEAARQPDSKDPKVQALNQSFATLQRELQQKDQEARAQVEKFNTTQVIEAYKLVSETAAQAATSLGYTHLIATRQPNAEIRSLNLQGAVQEILARPVVKGPIADDITDRLITQFNLENIAVPQGQGDAPVAPATPK